MVSHKKYIFIEDEEHDIRACPTSLLKNGRLEGSVKDKCRLASQIFGDIE